MTYATPQLIPKKKESGGLGLANWRASPGLKPATSPKPIPIDAPSLPSTETAFEDHIVSISVANVTKTDIDKVLQPSCGYATSHAYGYLLHICKPATVPLERENSDPFDKVELTGPAAHFKTPKPELVTTGGVHSHGDSTPEAPPAAALNKHGLPEMELPPAANTPIPSPADKGANQELFVAVYGTHDAADNAKHLINKAYPQASVTISTRKRGITNSTLVLKGVPFQTRIDSLVESLTSHLTCKPSYVRLHRSERGVFKCVIFFKFSTRIQAEHAKYELERITVGSRPLRVEYKTRRESPTDSVPSAPPSVPASLNSLPPAYGATKATPLLGSTSPAQQTIATMEQTLSAIALGDYDGCVYTASELKGEDMRYLAHLCIVSGLQLVPATPSNVPPEANISLATITASTTPEYLLVRKRPPPPPASSGPSGGIFDRNSPQFQPNSTPKFTPRVGPTTPQWTAHTPSTLQPMDFRGIRHWKEVRQEATSQSTGNTGAALGIIRPLGPDCAPPFGAGRGRPAR